MKSEIKRRPVMPKFLFVAQIAAAALLSAVSTAGAATYTVTSTSSTGPGSLPEQMTFANGSGALDTIVFDLPGPGPHVIELTNSLFINTDLEIINDNPGNDSVTVQRSTAAGTPDFSVVSIAPGRTVLIAGIVIANGRARSPGPFEGGAIRNSRSALTVRNCTLRDNRAIYGGAIFNTTFTGSGSGNASVSLINCLLTRNTTTGTFPGEGGEGGGAIYNTSNGGNATVTLTNCILTDNAAFRLGGAIANISSTDTASVSLNGCTFSGNAAASGGAIANRYATGVAATVAVSTCTFLNNQTTVRNGGNSDGVGGAIYNEGPARTTVVASTLSGNSAEKGGAIGMVSTGGNISLNDSTLGYNTAFSRGGGIYNVAGTFVVTNSTLSGNTTPNGAGGGIYNAGMGGKAELSLVNCTLAANSAVTGGTVRNDGSFGGSQNTILSLVNTLLKTGQSGENFSNTGGTINSLGHNLSDDAAGGDGSHLPGGFLNAAGDIRNLNPELGPLFSNGGPTQTHALSFSSPAIDAGDDTRDPAFDQRGFGRVRASDIGAFEFQANPAGLANISTRLRVETGDNVLIGGFIMTGTEAKRVIVRAIGPSLSAVGITDPLENPTLELHGPNGLIAFNDDWVSSPDKQAISDNRLAPANDFESAIIATLPADNTGYTAVVRGLNETTGTGVVEIYDVDRSVNSKLGNISTRGLVATNDNVLIAGSIVLGRGSQNVIIRAIGPSLALSGKLLDPMLELRDGNGALLEANDNWVDSPNRQAIANSGIPPADDRESAIIRALTPSAYTAIIRGVNNSTGIAVAEVYALN